MPLKALNVSNSNGVNSNEIKILKGEIDEQDVSNSNGVNSNRALYKK